jgi:hypothetical protein
MYLFAALALLLLGVPSVFASADETAFKEHCAKCHPRAASVLRGFREETAEERAIRLDKFLATHHAEDPKLRSRIVDFLVGLSVQ